MSALGLGGLWLGLALLSAAPPPEQVLEPGQERQAARMLELGQPELGGGWRLLRVEAAQGAARLVLQGPDGAAEGALLPPDAPGEGLLRLEAGALRLPAELPAAAREALVTRLSQATGRLRWRRLVARSDPERARRAALTLSERLEARLGAEAAAAGATGMMTQTEASAQLARHEAAPPGVVSAWMASAPADATVPCPGSRACTARVALSDLAAGRLDMQHLAPLSDEPRVLARAARLAHELGRQEEAQALLAQALWAETADADAQALARAWGWGHGGAAEAPGEGISPNAWLLALWLLMIGAAFLLREHLGRAEALACALALALGLGAAVWLGGLDSAPPPQRLEVNPGWLELGRGTEPCQVGAPAVTSTSWQALVRCPGQAAAVRISAGEAAPSVAISPVGRRGALSPELQRWAARLRLDLEASGLQLATRAEAGTAAASPKTVRERIAARPGRERDALRLAGPLVLAALGALLALLLLALSDLWALARRDRGAAWWLGAAATLAVLTHALAPARLVMVYDGYLQTADLVRWAPLRYGGGASWLYGPWLEWLGPDHGSVQLANRALGLASLVLLWALLARLVESRPRAAVALAALSSASPILWKDHASESILVGGALLLFAAMYGLAVAASRTPARPRPAALLLALPCALAAALSRPEYGLFAGPLALLILVQLRPAWSRRTWLALGLLTAGAVVVALPHVALTRQTLAWLEGTDALPGIEGLGSRVLSDLGGLGGLRVAVDWGPAALLALLPLALLTRGARALSLGLVVIALLWAAFTRVDLPEVSMPRVHAPPWQLMLMVGALGADALWQRLGALPRPALAWAARAGLVAAWLLTAYPTVERLYVPTNAEHQERLLRDAVAALPPGNVCLATLDERDPPEAGKTPRYFPYYLLADRSPQVLLSSLGELDRSPTACRDGVYALLGMPCYMALREGERAGPAPTGAAEVEGCRDFRRRWALSPLLERRVDNRGDQGFPLYPEGGPLTLGLYRVDGPRAGSGGGGGR